MSKLPLEKNSNVFQIMLYVYEGNKYQFEICEKVNITQPSVARFLSKLGENKYIEIIHSENRKKTKYMFNASLISEKYLGFVEYEGLVKGRNNTVILDELINCYFSSVLKIYETKDSEMEKDIFLTSFTIENLFKDITEILTQGDIGSNNLKNNFLRISELYTLKNPKKLKNTEIEDFMSQLFWLKFDEDSRFEVLVNTSKEFNSILSKNYLM